MLLTLVVLVQLDFRNGFGLTWSYQLQSEGPETCVLRW